ncbi:MAG: BadF/BadG/BcrA/BcrD ATPase family protein [Candidatus Sedimenticola endophacoides]
MPSDTDLREFFSEYGLKKNSATKESSRILITGKLAGTIRDALGCGKVISPGAAIWLAARKLIKLSENVNVSSLAMLDLSASGYLAVGVDRSGQLVDDLLVVNPRCGAGCGINLDRVLDKLAVNCKDVDALLCDYLGEPGRSRRGEVSIRADRCGVFSSSATISDKNQGIPLDMALATTLKSEVLKACKKLPSGFDKVYLTGRIFRWRFARECAEDYLRLNAVQEVAYDTENSHVLESLHEFATRVSYEKITQPDPRLSIRTEGVEYPSFSELRSLYEEKGYYVRILDNALLPGTRETSVQCPVILGLDVGSSMLKAVLANAETGGLVFQGSYSNAGDTIETIKCLFKDLRRTGVTHLEVRCIGITGSARYQVQKALSHIYPALSDRISVLVENYAHARGSIHYARHHIRRLKEQGFTDINEDYCILIDVGGEDTKISTIALEQAELFDNAMNLKCSAGTGSLMDTLSSMFGEEDVERACAQAYAASKAFAINATCAVFLMENATKLRAQGVPEDQILASANWAIVENMARTLWNQLKLPRNAVVLLHGQTMLSEPLPLAVTHRLMSYVDGLVFSLVPPLPGHRACFGLIRTLLEASTPGVENIRLSNLIDARFDKHIILCKGAACGDPLARCNRCSLSHRDSNGKKVSFTLGGCTAINELLGGKGKERTSLPRDTYKEIWEFIDQHHPKSEVKRRLIIPRSFAVSEWAYLLSRICEQLAIPVHVDDVRDTDLFIAQPDFNIDCCAPQMGAVGQFRRLAGEPHGIILSVQIESLPTEGKSRGLTCTVNQGGIAVAMNLAGIAHPTARFHPLHLKLDRLEAGYLCDQLHRQLQPLFRFYGVAPNPSQLQDIIANALRDHHHLREDVSELTADMLEEALAEERPVALVVGREYVLNPGVYDSHIRRLLRDKLMTVIPSYVLDITLDEDYGNIYWRNPHFIVSLLNAVSQKSLHRRLRHSRLRDIFFRIEKGAKASLLPVVQVSTFSCGPDSLTNQLVAEIMNQRPFLLIQSDAVLKELAHLENRVNTYDMQLKLGLNGKLRIGGEERFEVRTLENLVSRNPLSRESDVLYFPTLSDNRTLSSILRGAGYTCIDNYDDETYDLQALIAEGRKFAGDAVCAPLAGTYADLLRAVADFTRRKEAKDPVVANKKRVVFFDNEGSGPCRQGQYPLLHRLLFYQSTRIAESSEKNNRPCNALPGGAFVQLLIGKENEGYDAGFEEWVMLRAYQGVILQGVLLEVFFKGGASCRSYEEYERFRSAYRALKREIYKRLESYHGPSPGAQRLLRVLGNFSPLSFPLKYAFFRLNSQDLYKPIKSFVDTWVAPKWGSEKPLHIRVSGESYMRVSQAEAIFRTLLSALGFQRFNLEVTPLMSFLEYLLDEAELNSVAVAEVAEARSRRREGFAWQHRNNAVLKKERHKQRRIKLLRFVLRNILARPLYNAAKLQMPPASKELIEASKEVLPTTRPLGELAPYIGEAIFELHHGVDVLLNVGPNGCMVTSMGEMLTPKIAQLAKEKPGRIQNLFSTEGEINEELLTLAVLKTIGPERYYRSERPM